ncbi:hypothetical protein FOL46_006330 [Perkinsus olseni]|uniref:N-acetyltransferase domain-containing protein n=1 Tax=Perkinsus olseni TaxID=32597 RepID=A0A7J6LMF1_PEROL|nr:hypothetical protein FOL46_006330 [Perkinsus olseni]
MQGNDAFEVLKLPALARMTEELGYIEYVKVEQNSLKRGVGTWMLFNLFLHLKQKWPKVDSTYLMVPHENLIAKQMYEKIGFKRLNGTNPIHAYYRYVYPAGDH